MYRPLKGLSLALLVLGAATAAGTAAAAPLLQSPAASARQIVFSYAGDLWSAGTEGGEARRLTTGPGLETDPFFSPDGRQLAFTGQYEGNFDVYLMDAEGGVPRRLTYHPGVDRALGWTPDGRRVLFRSARTSYANRFDRLYTMGVEGGLPAEVPLPWGQQGSYSPDGSHLAFVPLWYRQNDPNEYASWKRYRGGMAAPIRIARLSDSSVEDLPHENSNDSNPLWVGDRIYFLSDRGGPVSLYGFDTAGKTVTEVVPSDGTDILSASAGPGFLVYEKLGALYRLDLSAGAAAQPRKLDIRISGDLPSVHPHFENVAERIKGASISPTGVRVAFEARGEILTVPVEKGDVRNLTRTPGAAERSPAWSPDGQRIAYFSDESGEYALHITDQNGGGPVKKVSLGDPPSFFYHTTWSPDSRKIAFIDKRLNFWYVDIDKGKPVRIDADTYETFYRQPPPVWSPDSRWIAYPKLLPNHLHAIHVYSLESGETRRITDGMSDALHPVFDRNGQLLYFTASTDAGPGTGWLDLSSVQRAVSRSVYVAVLRKDLPSPLAPQSDEEAKPGSKAKKEAGKAEEEKTPEPVRIDFDGIDQRTLALPIAARSYFGLAAGKTGVLFVLESPPVRGFSEPGMTLHRFDLATRAGEIMVEGVKSTAAEEGLDPLFQVSQDGEKLLYRQGDEWFVVPAGEVPEADAAALTLDDMEVYVDPRAEWRQMYREVWRIQRDFFYDPGFHGLDLAAAQKRYEPYLADIGHRADLNYLFNDMLGELTVGHLFLSGGESPDVPDVPGGLLGADYEIDHGRYRFARIYSGESWNPSLTAPLTQPGVNVKPGEYLLAVGGRELRASDNVYQLFEGTADRSVVLKVGPDPDGKGAREVTVVPVDDEAPLRHLAWVEDNRRKVDRLSKGRLAYVYLPNTGEEGYTSFNRYFFAQVDKQGVVVDERFNGGGFAADYVIDYLRRPLLNYWVTRDGADFRTPVGAIFGPKVMIINEWSASGGDAIAWYFRRTGLGPLVGKRTWGGLVGIYDYPELMDGGSVTAPRVAFWSPDGEWDVENHGVAPDIDVQLDPKAWREGRDLQLEKAVEVALAELEKNPPPQPEKPAYPDFQLKKKQ